MYGVLHFIKWNYVRPNLIFHAVNYAYTMTRSNVSFECINKILGAFAISNFHVR